MRSNSHNGFRLGDWQVYPLRNLLVGSQGEVHIEPKVMQVLDCLASKPGEVFERGELINNLWDGRALSDEPLTRCIAALRHALGDSPTSPKYIQTIPKSGYRLICPVESLEPTRDFNNSSTTRKKGFLRSRRGITVAVFLGLILITTIYATYRSMLTGSVVSPQLSIESKTQSEPPVSSIAVLPFRNHSAKAEDVLFVDGIHDDILMQLAKFSSLDKVISRTSVERYRDTSKSMPQIAKELGVATVIEGSVQRSGDRVRINVQLIDAVTDDHLWGEAYNRELTAENLFAVQSEISREIVGALQLVLTDEENRRLETVPTTNLEAYNEFVLGHQEMTKRTAEALYRAEAHFKKAIALDVDYSLAYVGLADVLALQGPYSGLEKESVFARRQAAIDSALALNPLLGEAYTSLASLRVDQFDYKEEEEYFLKYKEWEEYFLKGIKLSPNYAMAHERYATVLRQHNRSEEALPYMRKAVELDPMSAVVTMSLGDLLWTLGRVEEAQTTLLKGIERNPEFSRFYHRMAVQLWRLGRIGEAANWARAATRLAPSDRSLKYFECKVYVALGADQTAERCYESLEKAYPEAAFGRRIFLYLSRSQLTEATELVGQLAQRAHTSQAFLALSHFLIGEVDKARLIYQELEPQLYGDGDIFNRPHFAHTMARVAHTLYADGQLERANYLFDGMLDAMQSMHRTRGRAYGIIDVFIHVTRGEKQKAISALRDATDVGWRAGWWELRSPLYDSMREEPEWIDLVSELEADIDRQRQWYEDHKDDLLF